MPCDKVAKISEWDPEKENQTCSCAASEQQNCKIAAVCAGVDTQFVPLIKAGDKAHTQ